MSFQNLFSSRVKHLRITKGVSQSQLADILGTSRTAIANWETGLRIPLLETLCEIAAYFNVSLDYLTGFDNLSSNYTSEEAATLEPAI